MRTENSSIRMYFIYDDILKILKKMRPGLVIWKKRQMEHVRISDDNSRGVVSDLFSVPGGGIPVINCGKLIVVSRETVTQIFLKFLQSSELILGKCF